MSVTDPSTAIVFCEGEPGGPDVRLYRRILSSSGIGEVTVYPLAGKQGINSYVRGYLSRYQPETQPRHIVIRDRDLDIEPSFEAPQLLPLPDSKQRYSKHIYCTFRASIEVISLIVRLFFVIYKPKTASACY